MDEALIPTEAKARKAVMGGILLLGLGAVMTYFFAVRPLQELVATNHATYYLKGVLIGPLCLYMGALALTGKFGDGEIRKLNAKGKPTFTRKGWFAVGGAIVVIALTLVAWYGYLHALGFRETNGI
ncbi:hypothetical protein [Terriglobus aquaticus]|uniref:Uncharacterized protein n=1 Tax=Terriglobus aquaticus TaxID=940139 RepID=A0ABW9KPW3_9BACT|nr:hypothetical protein [Terriglobus aquaticus]